MAVLVVERGGEALREAVWVVKEAGRRRARLFLGDERGAEGAGEAILVVEEGGEASGEVFGRQVP